MFGHLKNPIFQYIGQSVFFSSLGNIKHKQIFLTFVMCIYLLTGLCQLIRALLGSAGCCVYGVTD